MAISILNNPTGNQSVQDNLWHTALSTASGQVDMKYVFDVYINNTQLLRAKIYPRTDGWGIFDASRVIGNEIKFDWFTPNNATTADHPMIINPDYSGQVAVRYQMRVGEDVSGVTTTNLASGNVTVFNWTPSLYRRRTNFDSKTWLTNRPLYAKSNIGEHLYVGLLCEETGDLQYQVEVVNWDGTTTTTTSPVGRDTTLLTSWGVTRRIVQLDLSAAKMNYVVNANVITANSRYYRLRIKNKTSNVWTDWFHVDLVCNPKYQPICLHFMNRYGIFETARFALVNKLSVEIERKNYKKADYTISGGIVSYKDSQNVYTETVINHSTKLKWAYKLTMDFPTDAEYQWLEELMYSPQIFAEIEDGFYSVTLKNTNYEYLKNVYAGLRQLEVDIDLNQKRFAFKR